jgi:uncharacterized protein
MTALRTFISTAMMLATTCAMADLPEGREAFGKRQYAEARKELATLAEQSEPEAMGMMGEMLLRGMGGNRDELKAREYITQAHEKGNLRAGFTLGTLYVAGNLVARDEAKGVGLIRQAAEKGHPPAQAMLGAFIGNGTMGYSKDETIALTWFKSAASQKDAVAMNWLGHFHEKGLGGVQQDNLLALDWYRKAAEAAHTEAMVSTGRMYALGLGVSPDGSEALNWLRKGAALGSHWGYIWIGSVYEFGRGGINKNASLAYSWYAAVPPNALSATVKAANDGKERVAKQLSATDLKEAEKQSKNVAVQNLINVLPTLATAGASANRKGAYGSGVVVSAAGDIVTNEHVVQGCTKLRAQPSGHELKLVAKDSKNDLALLRLSGGSLPYVKLRSGKGLRLGDEIIALGFPLRGLLSSGPIVTSGIVNAMSGVNNDTSGFQMSATVQPGSSGGPVFDRQGALVGIVRARLLTNTPANAQNVNFAINLGTLSGFLDAHSVDYGAAAESTSASVGDIVSRTQPSTIQVECV